jgi:TolB protein
MVTSGLSNARTPSLAPDGTLIAFAGEAGQRLQIWSVRIDGSGLTLLTDLRGGASDPSWSPDGSRIAFRADAGGGQTAGLYVMNSDGSDQRLLWAGQPFSLTWSQDGTQITFAASAAGGDLGIESMDVATGAVHRILTLTGSQSLPARSPDGSRIAFLWDTPAGSGLYTADADGSNLRRVGEAELNAADRIAWSPNGEWLAFQGTDAETGPQIFVVRPDGTGLRRVTDMDSFHEGPSVSGPNGTPGRTGDPSWGPSAG